MLVTHKNFAEALRLLKKFAGKPLTRLPVFECAELRVAANKGTLRRRNGDDAEITVELDVAAGVQQPFTLVVPVDATLKALKAVKPNSAGMVEIEGVEGKPNQIRVGPLVLSAGVNPEDLPAAHPALAVTADLLSDAFLDELSRLAPAMCMDVTRISLGGVWFDGAMCATDGHRMHMVAPAPVQPYIEHEGCTADDAKDCPQPFMPVCIVETVLAVKRPVNLRLGFRHFMQPGGKYANGVPCKPSHVVDGMYHCGSGTALYVTLRWRELETRRPDWREVSPSADAVNARLTLSVPDLRDHLALLVAHQTGEKKWPTVIFALNKAESETTLRAENYEAVKLVRTLYVYDRRMDVEENMVEVACNADYLVGALDMLGADEITIALNFTHDVSGKLEHSAPLVVTGVGNAARRVLIMPIHP